MTKKDMTLIDEHLEIEKKLKEKFGNKKPSEEEKAKFYRMMAKLKKVEYD